MRFTAAAIAAAPTSQCVQQTQRALDALAASTNSKTHEQAINLFPFGTLGWSNAAVQVRTDNPCIPFETEYSQLHGQYSLIPSALRVLATRQAISEDVTRYQEDNHDIVLMSSILATIGGRRTIDAALPALLCAVAARRNNNNFASSRQIMNGMVTLCGPQALVSEITSVMKSHPDPQARAAAALTLGQRDNLINSPILIQMPDGSYQQQPEQTRIKNEFMKAIPSLCRIASQDKDSTVRLAALEALHEGIYGTQSAPWSQALPYLSEALQQAGSDADARRAILRILSEMPYSPEAAFPVFRTGLADSDTTARGYAMITLSRLMITKSDFITRTFCSDLAAPAQSVATAHQLETAASVLWGYGDWSFSSSATVNHDNDNRFSNAAIAVQRPGPHIPGTPKSIRIRSVEQSPQEIQRHALLLGVLREYGLKSDNAEIRLCSARALENIGKDVDVRLSDGGHFWLAVPDAAPLQAALREASKTIHLNDPSLSLRLIQLEARIGGPHDR